MRFRPFILITLSVPLLAAASPTGCTLPWQALLGGLDPLLGTVEVRVVNDAYQPLEVSLVTSTIINAAASAPSTQPAGSATLEHGADQTWSFPCLTMPDVLAAKATLTDGQAGSGLSATSRTLRKDIDYSCGSQVTFTVRQAARVGMVVGDAVD